MTDDRNTRPITSTQALASLSPYKCRCNMNRAVSSSLWIVMLDRLLKTIILTVLCLQGQARQMLSTEMRARQQMAAEARRATLLDFAPQVPLNIASQPQNHASGPKNITFSNPKASGTYVHTTSESRTLCRLVLVLSWMLHHVEFFVDGKKIPQVSFDVGSSWAGLIPISGNANETRKVRTFSLTCKTMKWRRCTTSCSFGFSHLALKEA